MCNSVVKMSKSIITILHDIKHLLYVAKNENIIIIAQAFISYAYTFSLKARPCTLGFVIFVLSMHS